MRAIVNASVSMEGESGSINKTYTQDGGAGITPTLAPALAGFLSGRTSGTVGKISTLDPGITTGDKGVVTWVDASGNLKHRYNVACTVTNVGDESGEFSGEGDVFETAITGGAGDDLPALLYDVNLALQESKDVTFDFDSVDTFMTTTNVRGVAAFLDGSNAEKFVIDMAAGSMALWQRATGFPQPATGTPITHVLLGSGDTSTTEFKPKILAIYDATTSGE
jgi:hypothetical protein